ncbi:hypothetical protein ACVBEH_16655 [Roseateles sp. GG27B]
MADVFNLNLNEARDFMMSATGQDWPLQRLIGAGARVAVWLEPPPGASKELIAMAFLGLESGFAAPVLEGGDLQRLRFLRDSGTLSITMRPDDSPLRMSPPAKFVADDLRFSESSLQDIAARAIEAGMVKPASVLKQSAQAPQAVEPVTQAAPAVGEPKRRLDALRANGGDVKWWRSQWKVTGINALVRQEEGRPRSSHKTIRGDLVEAAETEKREGTISPSWPQ